LLIFCHHLPASSDTRCKIITSGHGRTPPNRDSSHRQPSLTQSQDTVKRLRVLGTKAADSLASPPDLKVADLLHLGLKLGPVVLLRGVFKSAASLLTSLDGSVKVVKDGLEGVLETRAPVDGTTTGSGGASGVHVVHTVGTDKRVKGLSGLLDSLVESLGRRVTTLTEDLVLGEEHAVNTTHQATTLTVKVRVDLLLESGLVEVTRADGDTESDSLLLGLAGDILVDGNGRVDTTALTEESTDGTARALGSDEDDVDIRRDLDLGLVLEDGGETVREIEGLQVERVSANGEADEARVFNVHFVRTLPFVSWGLMAGQVSDWAASERRFMMMVPFPMASSMSKRFLPATQPSCSASFHEAPFFLTPTMTFRPLSRRLRP